MPPAQDSKLSPAAVIGPGRVGLALAIFLDRIGVEVTVGARSDRGRERVEAAGLAVADPTEATRGASLVLLAVPDDGVAGAAAALRSRVTARAADGAFSAGQIVIHTAGVDGPGLLAPAAAAGARVAACHPVQIFNDDLEATLGRMPGTVWGVTGDPVGREVVTALGGRPMDVPESGRVRYHGAPVPAAHRRPAPPVPPPAARPLGVPQSGRVRYPAPLVWAASGCAALPPTAADQLRAGGVIDP